MVSKSFNPENSKTRRNATTENNAKITRKPRLWRGFNCRINPPKAGYLLKEVKMKTKVIEIEGAPSINDIVKLLPEEVRDFKLEIYSGDEPHFIFEVEINYDDRKITLS